MKNKLAIIGCATETRDDVDYNDPDLDIWVFNESSNKPWCVRADAVFQMHDESIWKSPVNRGDNKHGEWLMAGDTPPVYMLEKYPDVPKSIRYPREDIVDELLKDFTVVSERGRKDFFTSTIAYSLALGIYLGYKEISTFGIELADEAEYRQQLPAAMFWMGIGVGRGVKFISHSKMFDAPLYPLETFIGLDKNIFGDYVILLEPQCKQANEDYIKTKTEAEAAIKDFYDTGARKDEMLKAVWKQAEYGQRFGILDGARQENERYFRRSTAMENMTGTYVFSRHEFTRDQTQMGVQRNQAIVNINNAAAECQRMIERIEPKVFDSTRRHQFKELETLIDTYVKCAVIVGMFTGAINEDQRFIELYDEAMKSGGVPSPLQTDTQL